MGDVYLLVRTENERGSDMNLLGRIENEKGERDEETLKLPRQQRPSTGAAPMVNQDLEVQSL